MSSVTMEKHRPRPPRHRTARTQGRKTENLIECETRRGFHTSLGRGDPCTHR